MKQITTLIMLLMSFSVFALTQVEMRDCVEKSSEISQDLREVIHTISRLDDDQQRIANDTADKLSSAAADCSELNLRTNEFKQNISKALKKVKENKRELEDAELVLMKVINTSKNY